MSEKLCNNVKIPIEGPLFVQLSEEVLKDLRPHPDYKTPQARRMSMVVETGDFGKRRRASLPPMRLASESWPYLGPEKYNIWGPPERSLTDIRLPDVEEEDDTCTPFEENGVDVMDDLNNELDRLRLELSADPIPEFTREELDPDEPDWPSDKFDFKR